MCYNRFCSLAYSNSIKFELILKKFHVKIKDDFITDKIKFESLIKKEAVFNSTLVISITHFILNIEMTQLDHHQPFLCFFFFLFTLWLG